MLYLIQPTISLEMPVPSQGHCGFHSFGNHFLNKGNNKITELRTILQRESQNS
jgi:hypothetical protein